MTEKESSVLSNTQKLELAEKELKKLQHRVDKENVWGVNDTHEGGVPEGEMTWDQYLEHRSGEGVVRDEEKGGHREAHTGKFASEQAYRDQQEEEPTPEVESVSPKYDDMGVMALAKEAGRARDRHDTADLEEIKKLASDRILSAIRKSEEKDNRRYSPEDVQRRLDEDLLRFESLIDRFNGAEEQTEESVEKNDDAAPNIEVRNYENGFYGVSETFTGPNGHEVLEIADENGNTRLVYAEDFYSAPVVSAEEGSVGASSTVEVDAEEAVDKTDTSTESAQAETAEASELFTSEHEARDAEEEELIQAWLKDEKMPSFDEEKAKRFRAYSDYRKLREQQRGRLFPDRNAFMRYDMLTRNDEGSASADMGLETGFDQGQLLSVKRTSGEIEAGWTFLGVNAEGRAVAGKVGDEANESLYKTIDVEELKKLQSQAEQQEKVRVGSREWWKSNKEKFGVGYWSAKWNTFQFMKKTERQEAQEAMSDEEKEEARKKGRRNIIIGATVVAAVSAFALYKSGFSIDSGSEDALAAGTPDNLGVRPEDLAGEVPAVHAPEVSPADIAPPTPEIIDTAAFDIPAGGGGEQLFNRLGIDSSKWYANEQALLAKFPDSFYQNAGEHVRISRPGPLSTEVQTFIESLR